MATRRKAAARKLARRRSREMPGQQRPVAHPPPECCDFRVLVTGCTESAIIAIGNKITVDENLNVTAINDASADAVASTNLNVEVDAIVSANAAAVSPPPPPPAAGANVDAASDAKADGDTDSAGNSQTRSANDAKVRLVQSKAPDLVGKNDKYIARWKTIGARGPVVVNVRFDGEVRGVFDCAGGEGEVCLSNVKVIDSVAPRTHGNVRVTLDAADSCGQRDRCVLELLEP
jgi:hypothetical protein